MTKSIQLHRSPSVQYLLRLGDTCLIHGQRLAEWCGHAPVLEEDIAMANMALDLIGQARAVLTHAGRQSAGSEALHDEDQLAFLRDERDYFNPTLVELPNGVGEHRRDFAITAVRNLMVATLLQLVWQRLQASHDDELAAIAGKAVKEARYHQRHAADWVVRLGDGTAESRQRCETALARLWRYVPELFEADEVDAAAEASGLGPAWSSLRDLWFDAMNDVLTEAGLAAPAESAFRSTGRHGVHSEHMGLLLAEMQTLPRSFPGAVW